MTVQINSVEEAFQALVRLEEGAAPEEVEFGGELATLEIEIEGARYNGTVPGELARGLWQLQESIYAAAAFALTGVEDIRKLTTEQRSALELVFKVEEGSTDLIAALTGMFTKLGEGFAKMDSKSKMRTIILVALIAAGGVTGYKALDVSGDVKKDDIKASLAKANEAEQTKQFDIFTRALAGSRTAQKFDDAMVEGTKAIARGASDAESVRVGRTKLSADDVQEINQRAKRESSQANVVETEFRVISVEMRNPDQSRYVLSSATTGEFTAILNEADVSPDDIDRLLVTAKARAEIRLEVSITRNRGVVKAALITAIAAPAGVSTQAGAANSPAAAKPGEAVAVRTERGP